MNEHDYPHLATVADYDRFTAAVAGTLDGYTAPSSGACPGCAECGVPRPTTDIETAGVTEFTHSACDVCGRGLGGDRYPVHALDSDGEIVHFDACPDCVYFLEYGCLDDQTMIDLGLDRTVIDLGLD